tara:strand:+ start:1224 stop:2099 length:876 start_codon:yes stop_codon:yes gene_type:complete
MSRWTSFISVGIAAFIAMPMHAHAQREAPVQSNARPLGLDIVEPVQRARSDRTSRQFHDNFYDSIHSNLGLGPDDTNWAGLSEIVAVDASNIVLSEEQAVRVYFVNEDAGYQNALGYFDRPAEQTNFSNINPQLIFPNASSPVDYWDGRGRRPSTSQSTPVLPGDFVRLNDNQPFDAGTKLDFFVLPNGQAPALFSDSSLNQGGYRQFVAFAIADSPYIVLKVEDQYFGGDNDYNDAVYAIEIGTTSVHTLIAASAPLPAPLLALLLPIFIMIRRYMQRCQGNGQEMGAEN